MAHIVKGARKSLRLWGGPLRLVDLARKLVPIADLEARALQRLRIGQPGGKRFRISLLELQREFADDFTLALRRDMQRRQMVANVLAPIRHG